MVIAKCGECSDPPEAVCFCRECSMHLCEGCRAHHQRSRRTLGHSLIAIAPPPLPAAARPRASKAKVNVEADVPAAKGEPRRRNRAIASAQRRNQRVRQNQLITQLDSILPAKGSKSANGAGKRSLGAAGRSLQNVLLDTIENVRSWHACKAEDASEETMLYLAEEAPLSAGVNVHSSIFRDSIQSSHALAALEISMPGWTVLSANPGARHFFSGLPFMDIAGQCLLNGFVHADDEGQLELLWARACAGSRGGGKSASGAWSAHAPEAGCAHTHAGGANGLHAPAVGRAPVRMLVATSLAHGDGCGGEEVKSAAGATSVSSCSYRAMFVDVVVIDEREGGATCLMLCHPGVLD